METLLHNLNNRELAIVSWIGIAFILFLFNKAFRTFIKEASSILFSWKFLIIYFFLFGYLYFVLLGLKEIKLWDCYLIKDTVFWFIGAGYIILNSINNDFIYFKKVALDCVKITLVIEFIVNLHVFSYIAELIAFPLLIILSLLKAISDSDKKNESVSNLLNYLIVILGLTITIIAFYKTIHNYSNDFTFNNLQSLLLPSILTLLFIPFSYLLAVFSSYEILFVRFTNLKNKREIKKAIFLNAKLNLKRIKVLSCRINLYDISESENVRLYLKSI